MEQTNTKEIKELLGAFPHEQRFSLAILQTVQKEYGYISSENLTAIAFHLRIPVSEVFSIATFFKSLSLEKKGKIIIKVCDGTACHIRGSQTVLNECKRALGIEEGETTSDGLFSIEVVNCVGSCAMAPVMMTGATYHGNVGIGQAEEIIQRTKEEVESDE